MEILTSASRVSVGSPEGSSVLVDLTHSESDCYIVKCPVELLMMFSEALGADLASRASFASTCRKINQAVEPRLYKDDITWNDGYCMVWAAKKGQVQTMKKCIAQGGDIFRRFPLRLQGCYSPGPLLHLSVMTGRNRMVVFLLDQGFDIHTEAKGVCGCDHPTTFARSARSVYLDEPLSRYSCIETALHVAICRGHLSTARLLISRGALDHPTDPLLPRKVAIRAAAAFNRYRIFPDIIKGRESEVPAIIGAAPRSELDILDRPSLTRTLNTLHYGALHHACGRDNNIETIRALVELGADPNERIAVLDPTKGTPMHLAGARMDFAPVAHALMDLGANPEMLFAGNDRDAPTKTLVYILHRILCFDISYEEVPTEEITRRMLARADRLIQNGADFNRATKKRDSLIVNCDVLKGFLLPVVHCTYFDCAPAIMRFLLQKRADVEKKGRDGTTALATLVKALEIDHDFNSLITPAVERERRLFEGIQLLWEIPFR
ncbi:Ankyrin repeat-containing domain protein [Rhypophila sp. PSN 637]